MKIASPEGYSVAVEHHGDHVLIRVCDNQHYDVCSKVAVIGQVLEVRPVNDGERIMALCASNDMTWNIIFKTDQRNKPTEYIATRSIETSQ